MEQDQRKGLLCGLLAAGIRMEGLLRVAIDRPEAENEVAPQIREAFELYRKIFESVWSVEQSEATAPAAATEEIFAGEVVPEQPFVPEPVAEVIELSAEAETTGNAALPVTVDIESVPAADVAVAPEPGVLKLDELIARRESADLRRAFTLNDKFRFRRTLFGGSNERFSEVLDKLEAMTDGREAQKYLAALIDVESEDGADFMNIVNAHFGIRQ